MPNINIDLMDSISYGESAHISHNTFYDESRSTPINAVIQEDIEGWARRFAEMYRLAVANELTELHQHVDLDDYLKTKQDNIKEEMGLASGSNDMIAFDEYLACLHHLPNSKASIILENTKMGIELYQQFEDEHRAI